MPRAHIVRKTEIKETPRVLQLCGIFDIPPAKQSEKQWSINYDMDWDWNIGLIVGPSGCGKSTAARDIFGAALIDSWDWDEGPIVDNFPDEMSIQAITELLSSVGFSSPPGWLKPYHVLSTGEKFRVDLARTLAESPDLAVVDEFTSVVDRTVAQIGSHAIARTVRKKGMKFVAVSCHYDIVDWLNPDWIIEPHAESFTRRCLQRRPPVTITIERCGRKAWQIFHEHHYLSSSLHTSAKCVVFRANGIPAAFTAVIPEAQMVKDLYRIHRVVTLPDYQGIGLGVRAIAQTAALVAGTGKKCSITTAHPALIKSLAKDATNWIMTRPASIKSALKPQRGKKEPSFRAIASFRYVGPAADNTLAQEFWSAEKA